MLAPRVSLVIATYRRPALLARALASLAGQGEALAKVIVIDNGREDATAAVLARSPVPAELITPAENLGTAGGIAAGMRAFLADPAATHLWVLDDDALAEPGALAAMLAAASTAGADSVAAMVTDSANLVTWFPGPLPQPAWDVIRARVTPQDFVARCGPTPLRWNWATWGSLLVSRRAILAVGLPDEALWYQGSDIDYTLRLSQRFTCVLAPLAVCPHLPPGDNPARRRAKEFWGLQNGALIAVRRRYGWRALRHVPGNHVRYWLSHGKTFRAAAESWRAFWCGAGLGRPVPLSEYASPSVAP